MGYDDWLEAPYTRARDECPKCEVGELYNDGETVECQSCGAIIACRDVDAERDERRFDDDRY